MTIRVFVSFLICFFVFFGNSFSGFLPQVVYNVGKNADGSVIGDIDNDGENELIVGCRGSKDLHIFKSTGKGQNSLKLDYVHKVSWAMGVIDIADINRDGLKDVILSHYTDYTNASPKTTDLGICFQDPVTHKLKEEINYPFPSCKSSRAIAAGDVDSDNEIEIAVITEEDITNYLYIFGWNSEKDTLELEATYNGPGKTTMSIVIADVTGDGKNDVISHGTGITVYAQDENGKLKSPKDYLSFGAPAAVGDLNNDGLNDVACNTAHTKSTEIWYQNKTTNELEKKQTLNINSFTEDIKIADLNGDGRKDLAVSDRDNSILYIYYQDASGNLSQPEKYQGEKGKYQNELAVGDLNGDGMNDIIAANWGSESSGSLYDANVSVWFNDKPSKSFLLKNNESVKFPISFNSHTLSVNLPTSGKLTLSVYSSLGKSYQLIDDTYYSGGEHYFLLNPEIIASGIFFINLTFNEKKTIKQILYLNP